MSQRLPGVPLPGPEQSIRNSAQFRLANRERPEGVWGRQWTRNPVNGGRGTHNGVRSTASLLSGDFRGQQYAAIDQVPAGERKCEIVLAFAKARAGYPRSTRC